VVENKIHEGNKNGASKRKKIKMSRPKIGGEGSSIRHKDVVVCNVGQFFFPKGSGKKHYTTTRPKEREKKGNERTNVCCSIRWWLHDTPIGGHMREPRSIQQTREARQVCEGFFGQRFPGLLCMSRRSIVSSHSFSKNRFNSRRAHFETTYRVNGDHFGVFPCAMASNTLEKLDEITIYFTYAN
jgi:hypothetical protein